jgi:hypothetical protein
MTILLLTCQKPEAKSSAQAETNHVNSLQQKKLLTWCINQVCQGPKAGVQISSNYMLAYELRVGGYFGEMMMSK